jgi:hypothetical protein
VYLFTGAAWQALAQADLQQRLWPITNAFSDSAPSPALGDSVTHAGKVVGEFLRGVAMGHPALLWLVAGGLALGLASALFKGARRLLVKALASSAQQSPDQESR